LRAVDSCSLREAGGGSFTRVKLFTGSWYPLFGAVSHFFFSESVFEERFQKGFFAMRFAFVFFPPFVRCARLDVRERHFQNARRFPPPLLRIPSAGIEKGTSPFWTAYTVFAVLVLCALPGSIPFLRFGLPRPTFEFSFLDWSQRRFWRISGLSYLSPFGLVDIGKLPPF